MARTFLLLLLTGAVAACGATKASERQRRVADCLSECRTGNEPIRPGPFDPGAGERDQRGECEKHCQSR